MAAAKSIDSTIQIVTPENIAFEYRVAGPFRRLPAFLIDLALRMVFFFIIMFLLSFVAPLFGAGMTMAFGIVLAFVLEWFYGGLFETFMNGQTPGKWMLGLRVLTIDGQPITGLQAVMRNILRAVDTMPWVSLQALGTDVPIYIFPLFTLGLVSMALNDRYQRLGDLVCGTMVVVEERTWLRGAAKLEDPRAAQLAQLIPANFIMSRTLSRAIALYVDRRERLPVGRRREVARHLAEPLLRQFQLPPDTSYDLLLCALYHRKFIGGDVERAPNKIAAQEDAETVAPNTSAIAPQYVQPPAARS